MLPLNLKLGLAAGRANPAARSGIPELLDCVFVKFKIVAVCFPDLINCGLRYWQRSVVFAHIFFPEFQWNDTDPSCQVLHGFG